MYASIAVLLAIVWLVWFVNDLATERRERKAAEGERSAQTARDQKAILVRSYKGTQSESANLFEADAAVLAADGYFPVSQNWAPGQWSGTAFAIAFLLIFLFGLGLLILAYLLIVRPPGTLVVTYGMRTLPEADGKICPVCAETIKLAALRCRFCGYSFDGPSPKQSHEGTPD